GQSERPGLAFDLSFGRPGIGGLHEAGPAAGDDVHAHARQLEAERLHLVIDWIPSADARAAEDRNAVMLDALRLDLVEVADRLAELVDRLVEDVARIDARAPLPLPPPELLQLRRRGTSLVWHASPETGAHMLPRDPDVFRKLLQLPFGGSGVGLARESHPDA